MSSYISKKSDNSDSSSDNKSSSSDNKSSSSDNKSSSSDNSSSSIKKYNMDDMGQILKTYGTIAEELELRYNESKDKIQVLKQSYKTNKNNLSEKSQIKLEYNNEVMNMDANKLKMKKLLKQVYDSVKNAYNELNHI
jgi:hypothetical protein